MSFDEFLECIWTNCTFHSTHLRRFLSVTTQVKKVKKKYKIDLIYNYLMTT